MELLQADVGNIIDLCEDSPASDEVQALQSQASRISDLGSRLATVTATPTTNSHGITAAPTATMTGTRTRTGTHSWSTEDWDSESWTSILATATWASRYLSRISAGENTSQSRKSVAYNL